MTKFKQHRDRSSLWRTTRTAPSVEFTSLLAVPLRTPEAQRIDIILNLRSCGNRGQRLLGSHHLQEHGALAGCIPQRTAPVLRRASAGERCYGQDEHCRLRAVPRHGSELHRQPTDQTPRLTRLTDPRQPQAKDFRILHFTSRITRQQPPRAPTPRQSAGY